MRLVCPNCVAQYEVADGTIPESGRDVQCANCKHIWFQDAAFKLSTDDLTHVPQQLRGIPGTDHVEEDDGDDDAPGIFLSKRGARGADAPTEAAERSLPEVGDNVLDILRSEAAFSSRRRAAARIDQAEPQPEPEAEPQPEPQSEPEISPAEGAPGAAFGYRRISARASNLSPPPQPEADAPPSAEAHRTTDNFPEEPDAHAPAADFRALDWRHPDDGQPGGGWEPAGPDSATTFLEEEPEHVRGLAADEAKRIAEAAVARGEPAEESQAEPDAADSDEAAWARAEAQAEEFRQAIRRVSVRSLADSTTDDTESSGAAQSDLIRKMPQAADEAPEEPPAEAETERAEEEDSGADAADALKTEEAEEMADLAEAATSDDVASPADPAAAADETTDLPPVPEGDPDDIRQVRRSLVENRKVMLPDVDELNTSLRMEDGEQDVDLRSSAFSEEAAANRNRFWLGLVTALMLFGILWALYLMGPAISDAFPAADPYVAAFRNMADSALDSTAGAWAPVVAWLESL